MQTHKLYRSEQDKMIAGVCGGLAAYLNIDPTVVRAIFILLALTPLHGVLIYIILWIITPREPQYLPPVETPPASV